VSIIIGLCLSLLVFLGMNVGEVIPRTGTFIVPDVMPIITALVIVPVFVLLLMLMLTCIQLIISNPRTAMVIYTFILVAAWIAIIFITFYVKDANYYPYIYLGLIAIVGIVLYLVSRSLTPEKVVLSSKG